MALRCLGSGGAGERLEILDAPALSYPASGDGWTIFCAIYPDSGIGANSFAYIYSHGEPLATTPAVNIMKVSPGGQIRFIIDWAGGNLVDFQSSNAVVGNSWNGLMFGYDGTNARITLNGVETTSLPPALPDIDPTVNARIGYAAQGGAREWNGRIAEMAKFDRTFATDERITYTQTLISPRFAQNDKIWHCEMFNASFFGDVQNTVTVNEVGALYGDHAAMYYPADPAQFPAVMTPPVVGISDQADWRFA